MFHLSHALLLLGLLDSSSAPEQTPHGALVAAVLEGHNRERAAEKLGPLTIVPKLTAAAQKHADDMAAHSRMSHEGSDGSTPFDRIKREDYLYRRSGENVAYGQRTAEGVMKAWMDSPPHKENILGKFTQVGIAVADDEKGIPYWCVDFGTPWPKLDTEALPGEIVVSLNKARATARKRPLKASSKLDRVARSIAESLANSSDQPADKSAAQPDLVALMKAEGYRYRSVSEAVAYGIPTADEVVQTWLDDPTQKANVLGDFEDAGLGIVPSKTGAPFWCLVLGRKL